MEILNVLEYDDRLAIEYQVEGRGPATREWLWEELLAQLTDDTQTHEACVTLGAKLLKGEQDGVAVTVDRKAQLLALAREAIKEDKP